jgi:hypothetical protein
MSFSKIKIDNLSPVEINKLLADAWLNINVDKDDYWNPLETFPSACEDNPEYYLTWLLSQPEYFQFICREILNIDIYPTQGLVLQTLWNHKFPMLIASRGFSKSFTLALYALLRMILLPGRKLVITGAAFRQSKIIFEYMETIWNNAPVLRSMCGTGKDVGPTHGPDMWTFRIGQSMTKALPMGTGDKIRGQRAHDIITDEFASIAREIFEVVVSGFAAVSADPITSLKREATKRLAQYLNIPLDREDTMSNTKDNQIVISGTAYYEFNHFAEYWKRWHQIISANNDLNELKKIKADSNDSSHFAIMRIPVDLIPRGFMDEAQIARSKATVLSDVFLREFGAVFAKDSNGFFKRSLIEMCVASPTNEIRDEHNNIIVFYPALRGNPAKKHVIAVDPASEQDNFAVVILELNPGYRRVVYGWTTNKKEFNERRAAGLTDESNFYAFAARKIRQLIKAFPCELVMMDSQGGGVAVLEALHDKDKIDVSKGEQLIWETIVPGEPKPTDGERGLHVVELVNFADSAWTAEANHGLKKDFGDKLCLFPFVDAIEIAKATNENDGLYDTIEDCIFEIEELKNELSIIVMTKTPTGRDKWDTPDTKIPGSKKGEMRKDRYSALIMANMGARQLLYQKPVAEHDTHAGWTSDYDSKMNGPSFQGPDWLATGLNNLYD